MRQAIDQYAMFKYDNDQKFVILLYDSTGNQMYVERVKQRQAKDKVNRAAEAANSLSRPLGGWIATFQEAIGMNTPALARRLGIARNSAYSSIQNECSGSISLNQLDKMAKAMDGKLVYAIVPREGPVEEIVMIQARKKAERIVQRARAHMAFWKDIPMVCAVRKR